VFTPGSQNFGYCAYESGFEDLESFERLAREYKVDGKNRTEICRFNASVSQTSHFVGGGVNNAGLGRI